jgi:hypothetical protein
MCADFETATMLLCLHWLAFTLSFHSYTCVTWHEAVGMDADHLYILPTNEIIHESDTVYSTDVEGRAAHLRIATSAHIRQQSSLLKLSSRDHSVADTLQPET